jgi:hypothetical protein
MIDMKQTSSSPTMTVARSSEIHNARWRTMNPKRRVCRVRGSRIPLLSDRIAKDAELFQRAHPLVQRVELDR